MTTTEPTTMQAGRELDEQTCDAVGIAPRILFTAQTTDGGSMLSDYQRGVIEQFIAGYRDRMPNSAPAQCTVGEVKVYPRVSEDVGAAWQVVEAVLARDAGLRVHIDSDLAIKCRWGVTFSGKPHLWSAIGDAVADTLPLAICLAALSAATPSPTPEAPADAR